MPDPRTPAISVVTLDGELDLTSRNALRERFADEIEADVVIVDMTTVRYMDSTLFGALLGFKKRLRERGADMVIVVSLPQILRLFQILDLHKIFVTYQTLDAAMQDLLVRPGGALPPVGCRGE